MHKVLLRSIGGGYFILSKMTDYYSDTEAEWTGLNYTLSDWYIVYAHVSRLEKPVSS